MAAAIPGGRPGCPGVCAIPERAVPPGRAKKTAVQDGGLCSKTVADQLFCLVIFVPSMDAPAIRPALVRLKPMTLSLIHI